MSLLYADPETTVGTLDNLATKHPTTDMLIHNSLKGGDGLVAARHLAHYGYNPTVYYPKEGKNELYQVRHLNSLPTLAIKSLNIP